MGDPSTLPYLVARNVARGSVLASRLETATGLWARGMGLMGRAAIPADGGLWLGGTNGIHMMFMRFPIDAVFVGKSIAAEGGARPVLSVHHRLRAWTGIVPLVRGADGVLELPVGAIERSGTVVGDRILMEPAGATAG
jgi:uncharacterized membrane protein (UPF0127 family)